MKTVCKLICASLIMTLVICSLCSCASQISTKEPVIADGLVEFTVDGETDVKGNFYISFPRSRDFIMLDGKGNVVWSKHEGS